MTVKINDLLKYRPNKVLLYTPFGFQKFKTVKQLEKFVSANADKSVNIAITTTKHVLVSLNDKRL